MDLVILAIAFVVILAGAELFTNGIEWFGRKLNLAEGAVGSVLAAVGTALPETMIPVVAIIFGGRSESSHVGVGAILGAPFMLSTLAMFVTGVAVLVRARGRSAGDGPRDGMAVDTGILATDVATFGGAYALAIAAAFLPADLAWPRWLVAVALVLIYARYVKGHLDAEATPDDAELAPLRFHRLDPAGRREDPDEPRLRVVGLQVCAALLLILGGAVAFVDAVDAIAAGLGVDQTLLALVIAPIATELPEKFNSVLWIRSGKDTLAMGNITGAMVFQATIPTVVGLLFASTAWVAAAGSYTAFASAGIAFVASAVIFVPMARSGRLLGRSLLVGGALYALYLVIVIMTLAGHG